MPYNSFSDLSWRNPATLTSGANREDGELNDDGRSTAAESREEEPHTNEQQVQTGGGWDRWSGEANTQRGEAASSCCWAGVTRQGPRNPSLIPTHLTAPWLITADRSPVSWQSCPGLSVRSARWTFRALSFILTFALFSWGNLLTFDDPWCLVSCYLLDVSFLGALGDIMRLLLRLYVLLLCLRTALTFCPSQCTCVFHGRSDGTGTRYVSVCSAALQAGKI